MSEEENYHIQYLYNAVIEYIYFVISYIHHYGPSNITILSKHMKFFKDEVDGFVATFDGKTPLEKLGNMFCSSSHFFMLSEGMLALSDEDESFKEIIFEDFIFSKTIDLILKGVTNVQDICDNINLSNSVNIEKETLCNLLQNSPYFDIGSNSSVSILQFHGLLGFDSYTYNTIVHYFHSYLQSAAVLTYHDVRLHSNFVPTCGVRNVLVVLCVLYFCNIFRCRNGHVRLRKKPKKKSTGNAPLDMELLSTILPVSSASVGFLVREARGTSLHNWFGEIGNVQQSSGHIYCVVDFTNSYQGMFCVYFNKASLKQICDIKDLKDYLNIRDVVEFDAEYSKCGDKREILWKATRIKLVKQMFKHNSMFDIKRDTDDTYFQLFRSLKASVEKCVNDKCFLNEFDINPSNICVLSSVKDGLSSSVNLKCVLPVEACEEIKNEIHSPLSESADSDEIKSTGSTEIGSWEAPISSLTLDNTEISNENVNFDHSNLEIDIASDLLLNVQNHYSVLISDKVTEKENLPTTNQSDCVEYLNNNNEESTNGHLSISNLLFLDFTFLFGTVKTVMANKGMASAIHKNKCYDIFFTEESCHSEFVETFKKGRKMLFFIPYFDEKSILLVATFAYALSDVETEESDKNFISAKEFSVNVLNKVLKQTEGYCCDYSKNWLFSQVPFKTKLGELFDCTNLAVTFQQISSVITNSYGRCESFINVMYKSNLVDYKKVMPNHFDLFLLNLSQCRANKMLKNSLIKKISNLNVESKIKRNRLCFQIDDFCNRNNHKISIEDLNASPTESSKGLNIMEQNVTANLSSLRRTSLNYRIEGSSSSLNSFISCNSGSSFDTYHSCESLVDTFIDTNSCCLSENSVRINIQDTSTDAKIGNFLKHTNLPFERKYISGAELLHKENGKKSRKFVDILSERYCRDLKYQIKIKQLNIHSIPPFKHRIKKKKKIWPKLETIGCKNCHKKLIKTTGCIVILTSSCIYFKVKIEENNLLLGFPRRLIPEGVERSLKLNSNLEILVLSSNPLHLSHVLSIELK